jgi:hypothetical protein
LVNQIEAHLAAYEALRPDTNSSGNSPRDRRLLQAPEAALFAAARINSARAHRAVGRVPRDLADISLRQLGAKR